MIRSNHTHSLPELGNFTELKSGSILEEESSPGPGQYGNIYSDSMFANKSRNEHMKIQEFGSKTIRFPDSDKKRVPGPGSYEFEADRSLALNLEKPEVCFGSTGPTSRDLYIKENARMSTPGRYDKAAR